MTDREKLIDILMDELPEEHPWVGKVRGLVDTLIDNGVVVREKGEWIGEGDGYADGELVYDVWYCPECNHCIDDGTDDPALLPKFCPNCGADMRKGG